MEDYALLKAEKIKNLLIRNKGKEMMDAFFEILKEVNIAQILVILGAMSYFYTKLDKKLGDRIDKLSEKVENIDKRLCRIEGSLSTHGHCLLNQCTHEKKAE